MSTATTEGRTSRARKTDLNATDNAPKPPSRLDQLVMILSRAEGATLADMMAATGWQQHSIRGALAGALKKRGHVINSQKTDGVRRYIIEPKA